MFKNFLVENKGFAHGIAPTVLRLDHGRQGRVFITIISTKGINEIKKGKSQEKSFMHTIRFNNYLKDGYNSVCV